MNVKELFNAWSVLGAKFEIKAHIYEGDETQDDETKLIASGSTEEHRKALSDEILDLEVVLFNFDENGLTIYAPAMTMAHYRKVSKNQRDIYDLVCQEGHSMHRSDLIQLAKELAYKVYLMYCQRNDEAGYLDYSEQFIESILEGGE